MAVDKYTLPSDSLNAGPLNRINNTEASAAAVTTVTRDVADAALIAADADRRGLMIYNDADDTLVIKFGGAATSTDFTIPIAPFTTFIMPVPIYTGVIHGLWL